MYKGWAKKLGWLCLLLMILLPACQAARAPVNASQPFELVVAHVNDTHSHVEAIAGKLTLAGKTTYLPLGGMPRLATQLKQVRGRYPHALFLHAGDAVQGTIYFLKYHGKIEMELLNSLGCDAMVLGNHEFDRGPQGTGRIVGWASFPVLAANLDASREPALKGKLRPYIIKQVAGQKVGIIGLITPDTAFIANVGPRLKFLPVAPTARKYIAELQARGVNKIILLTHQGYERDLKLAREVAGIDLIVGGHSHTLLGDAAAMGKLGLKPEGPYPTLVKGPGGLPVYVVQAWQWAEAAGVMRLRFDHKGVVQGFGTGVQVMAGDRFRQKQKGKKVLVSQPERQAILAAAQANPAIAVGAADKKTLGLIAPYRQGLTKLLTTVVAKVAQDLYHIRVPGVSSSGKKLPQGSQVAPLVARAMLWKVRSTGMKVDLAWQNAGGVRGSIMAGDLTIAGAFSLLPFGNTLVVIELSGQDLIRVLDWGVSTGGGAFPYLAGARYTADMSRPAGKRIVRAELAAPGGQWRPVDPKASYRLVTSSFVAHGGDDCKILAQAKGYRYDTGFVDADAFMDYARKLKILKPLTDSGVVYRAAK